MAGTSMGSAIDALLTMFRGLAFATSTTNPIPVYDGFPDGPNEMDAFVTVGGGPEAVVVGNQMYGDFKPQKWEDFSISCWIQAYVGGSTSTALDSSDAQRTARNQVIAAFQQIEAAILADSTLSNGGSAVVSNAEIANVSMSQTDALEADAGLLGRRCSLNFAVHIRYMEA